MLLRPNRCSSDKTQNRSFCSLSFCQSHLTRLCDKGAGGGALVSPAGRQDTDSLIVARQTVDTRLDENEAELAVLVLSVALEVLADGDGLLDKHCIVLVDR